MRRAALVVVVLASALLVFGTARPAHACSCAVQDDAVSFANADAVFVGRLVDVQVQSGGDWSSTDPKRWIFEVDGVYRGDVFSRQSIVSARDGASCGLELGGIGGQFLVYARRTDSIVSGAVAGEYYANLCGGSRAVSTGDALPASIATPSPPKAGASPVGTFTAARAPTTAAAPAGPLDVSNPPVSSTWNWVAFVVAVLLAIAAVIAIRRRARTIAP